MRKFRLWITFCFMMAMTSVLGFVLTGFFIYWGMRLNFVSAAPAPWVPFTGLIGAAAIFSFCLVLIISRHFFAPVHELIQALKKVADGNFAVSLPEEKRWEDIRKMNQNFNQMVKELNSIELIQSEYDSGCPPESCLSGECHND